MRDEEFELNLYDVIVIETPITRQGLDRSFVSLHYLNMAHTRLHLSPGAPTTALASQQVNVAVFSQLASYLSVSTSHVATLIKHTTASSLPNKTFLRISRKREAGLARRRAGGWNIGGSQLST